MSKLYVKVFRKRIREAQGMTSDIEEAITFAHSQKALTAKEVEELYAYAETFENVE